MNRLTQLLFKPKWQDKDPAVRRSAVNASDDPELLAALPRLLREDSDTGVRLAALKRLNDYEHWRERSTGDADKLVRDTARGTYVALLCAASTLPPLSRRIAELDTLSADELERVALSSVDRELRAAALMQVSKPAVLVDRAVSDPDPRLRLAALERIADPNLLERVAERARKTDKAVAKRARERLESMRISAGDARAIAEKARALCEAVDALMRRPHAELAADLKVIEATWNSLGAAIPADSSARYFAARALALRGMENWQNPPAPAAAQTPLAPAMPVAAEVTEAAPVVPLPPPDRSEELASRARFDAALAAAQVQARAERDRRKALQHEIEVRLPELAAAVDAGNAAQAHRINAAIESGLKALVDVPMALQQQFAPLAARYAELKRWQHWSNNQRRRVLCTDVEALSGSGLHPDAVATRVREARDEWQRMSVAEGVDPDADAGAGIARRFHALCQHTLRPTKGYFSKRKEVRKSHEEEIAALLQETALLPEEMPDFKAIAVLRRRASDALRTLDGVPPQSRTALAKQLKDAIARLQALGQAHERAVEDAKRALIDQAKALAERGDGSNAARDARELQKKWNAAGNGRRSVDQRQWHEFRGACDAVFGKLDAARKEREEKVSADHAQTQQLVQEFETLASADAVSADELKSGLRELETRWQALGTQDRAFVQRQRQARDAIALQLKDAVRRKRVAHYVAALEKYTQLRGIESAGADGAGWHEIKSSPAFDAALHTRHAHAAPATSEQNEHARDVLVQLEFLGGLESPGEDRQRRMNHQVARLSSRLRGGTGESAASELDALLTRWFSQPPQPTELELRFERAARAAIDSLP